MGVRTEETENALELRDEGETELGVRFLGIVGRSVAELPVGLGTDGGGSLDGGAGAGDGLGRGNERGATALDLLDAPLDFGGPSLLDFMVLEEAGNQPVREPRPLLSREPERLSFYGFELAWHGGDDTVHRSASAKRFPAGYGGSTT